MEISNIAHLLKDVKKCRNPPEIAKLPSLDTTKTALLFFNFKKIQTKQNHTVRLMFFATYGENMKSAGPLLNLLELLNVENIYKLQILTFSINGTKTAY